MFSLSGVFLFPSSPSQDNVWEGKCICIHIALSGVVTGPQWVSLLLSGPLLGSGCSVLSHLAQDIGVCSHWILLASSGIFALTLQVHEVFHTFPDSSKAQGGTLYRDKFHRLREPFQALSELLSLSCLSSTQDVFLRIKFWSPWTWSLLSDWKLPYVVGNLSLPLLPPCCPGPAFLIPSWLGHWDPGLDLQLGLHFSRSWSKRHQIWECPGLLKNSQNIIWKRCDKNC